MIKVEGQIESLKKLKDTLYQNGITRFNSIGEINSFIKNYDIKKSEVSKYIEQELDLETRDLQSKLIELQQNFNDLKSELTLKINNKINTLTIKINQIQTKRSKDFLMRTLLFPQFAIAKSKKSNLEKNIGDITLTKTRAIRNDIFKTKNKLDFQSENKGKIILERGSHEFHKLDFTKKIIEELYPVIAGAIGESLVVKELGKLNGNYFLINDFSLEFNPPIYNRKEKDRIFSIQIDHLLISNSGIFILETKNWSRDSIRNFDLRSPIKQIMRTSYALFVLLNSDSESNEVNINNHHWGDKQIPIRSIIVMINEKPKEEFKYVKVKSLNELNGYITYFDPIFSDNEVENISDYFRVNQN